MWRGRNHGPRPAGANAAGKLIPDAAGEPREDGEELRELAPFGDLRLQDMLLAVTDNEVPSTR